MSNSNYNFEIPSIYKMLFVILAFAYMFIVGAIVAYHIAQEEYLVSIAVSCGNMVQFMGMRLIFNFLTK